MAVTWTISTVAKVPGLANLPVDGAISITGDVEIAFDTNVNAGQTVEMDFGSIDNTKIAAYIFHSSLSACTVNTNAVNASGGNSFSLAAGKAIEWDNTLTSATQITAA